MNAFFIYPETCCLSSYLNSFISDAIVPTCIYYGDGPNVDGSKAFRTRLNYPDARFISSIHELAGLFSVRDGIWKLPQIDLLCVHNPTDDKNSLKRFLFNSLDAKLCPNWLVVCGSQTIEITNKERQTRAYLKPLEEIL